MNSLLPADELSDIRDEAELALPDTCTIRQQTQTNTKGSVANTYPTDTYTNIPFRLASADRQAVERQLGLALAAVTQFVGAVPFDQPLNPTNRIVHEEVIYEFVAPMNDLASWRSVRRVFLKRIQ